MLQNIMTNYMNNYTNYSIILDQIVLYITSYKPKI